MKDIVISSINSIPKVEGPIPVTEESHPFSSAAYAREPLNLEEFGYEVIRIPNYIVNKEFNGLINYLLEYCREKCKDFDLEFIYNVERNRRTKFK